MEGGGSWEAEEAREGRGGRAERPRQEMGRGLVEEQGTTGERNPSRQKCLGIPRRELGVSYERPMMGAAMALRGKNCCEMVMMGHC